MDRLSWPGWLVIYWDRFSCTGSWTPDTVTHPSTITGPDVGNFVDRDQRVTTKPNRHPLILKCAYHHVGLHCYHCCNKNYFIKIISVRYSERHVCRNIMMEALGHVGSYLIDWSETLWQLACKSSARKVCGLSVWIWLTISHIIILFQLFYVFALALIRSIKTYTYADYKSYGYRQYLCSSYTLPFLH